MSNEQISEKIAEVYDDATRDLPLEDAIEVAENVMLSMQFALMGLREDQKNA